MTTAPSDVAHLLRRAGFGGSSAQITSLAALDLSVIVDQLLNDSTVTQPARPSVVADPSMQDWERWQGLGNWWFDRMADAPVPLVEKALLFWHGHLTAAYEKVGDTDYLWRMHAVQRANALGNIHTMAKACAIEPAMLVYLDNARSVASSPNQNFARELLELFLMGVGKYSEADVTSCARAWSGHNLNDTTDLYAFRLTKHDNGQKTFLGVTRNWDGPEIIDFLFTDPTQQVVVARYFAERIWSFFAHPNPPANVVTDLATVLINGSFEMKPLLRALFQRTEFYAPAAKQGLVRSPIEFFVSFMRASGLRSADVRPMQWSGGFGQEPFNPPNVSGWRPNRYWLSAGSAGQKAAFAQNIHWNLDDKGRGLFNDLPAMPVPQAVDTALARVGVTEPSPRSRQVFTDWLTAQRAAPYEDWFEKYGLTVLVLLLPELQLA
jgi:uncharacterized protein (DUF1800 family)